MKIGSIVNYSPVGSLLKVKLIVMWYYCAVTGESKKLFSRVEWGNERFLESPQVKIIFKTLQAPAQ
jgi:hypothetical protein